MNTTYYFETPCLFSSREYESDEQAKQKIHAEFPRAFLIYAKVEEGKMRLVWQKDP